MKNGQYEVKDFDEQVLERGDVEGDVEVAGRMAVAALVAGFGPARPSTAENLLKE